jgi:hypothetical protein
MEGTMTHRNVRLCFYFVLITFLSPTSFAFADEQDVVLDVRQCDRNIIVQMQKAGAVAFSEEDVGELDFEEMMTTAYEFMLSGEKAATSTLEKLFLFVIISLLYG